jgi:hypothetical protein
VQKDRYKDLETGEEMLGEIIKANDQTKLK